MATKYAWDRPVVAAAACAVRGVWMSDGVRLVHMPSGDVGPGDEMNILNTTALAWSDEGLWVGAGGSLMLIADGAVQEEHAVGEPVTAFASGADAYAVAPTRAWRREAAGWSPTPDHGAEPTGAAVSRDGTLWLVAPDSLRAYNGAEWRTVTVPAPDAGAKWAMCYEGPPAPDNVKLQGIAAGSDGHLWLGTSEGLLAFDGHDGWFLLRGRDGLPIENVTSVAVGDEGDVWLGTPDGVCLLAGGRWEYYAGPRWMPGDDVTCLAGLGRDAWVGTGRGPARIARTPYTLEAKAAHFEEQVRARHNRYGYVTITFMDPPGDLNAAKHEASDNDGLWTAMYIAAESYRYSVTGSEDARQLARQSMDALLRLEEVTPIDGFPARALMRKDEENAVQSGGEWHDTPDGEWTWKADTSSDEIDGHFYAFCVYYDLVADDAEKRRIEAVAGRIATHLIDNGHCLIDMDGQVTRWGVWAPERLNVDWKPQQGLNSLEILAIYKAAHHLTGDAKYDEAYRDLAYRHHYALNTIDQKLTAPEWVNHSDDELAFLSYYTVLSYETDPGLRAIYLASLERSWEMERAERCPLWNFMYSALTSRLVDVQGSILTLQEWPMDLISWQVRNSHRADVLARTPAGGWTEEMDPVVLPYYERPTHKWNGNPFRLDGGNAGSSEEDGTVFLLPYWMGRHYGIISDE
jgi:hypothetical protein